MPDFSDEDWNADGDNCGWDGPEDPDQFIPPDPTDIDDQAWLADQFARDAERILHEPPHIPDDDPPELTAEEFAREILDGGADAAAGLLGSIEPGPRSAALLAVLKPASLSPASMVSVIAATEKLASWVQARQHRWLATFACPGVAAPVNDLLAYASQPGQPLEPKKSKGTNRAHPDDGLSTSGSAVFGDPDIDTVLDETAMKVAAAEVGAALHFSPMAAQRRVCQAVEFAVDLPSTLRALEEGSIDRGRSLTIAERTQNLPVELRRRVELAVLPKATTRTPGQLRGIVDRAVISVDPAAAKKRHERAVAQRNVTHRAAEDGMGVFRAELSADKAQLAYSVIDQLAYQLKRTNLSACDPRGVGALRADVFSDLIDQLASTGTVTIRTTLRRRASRTTSSPAQPASTDTAQPATSYNTSDRAGWPGGSTDGTQPDGAAARNETVDSADVDLGIVEESAGRADDDASSCSAVDSDGGDLWVDSRGSDCGDFSDSAKGPDEDGPWVGVDRVDDTRQTAGDPSSGNAGYSGSRAKRARGLDTGLGAHQGRVTHLNVTIAASTLAGLDDRPGELDGHGPIPADLARAIAASASTIAAIAINPGCGTGLDLGRTVYRPRLAQRDHVTTRDQTCRFPGCRRSAKRCQIDHSDEFCPGESDGGVTCPCNLQCLCVFHHGLKTSGLWDSIQHPDSSVTWTSPTGRTYATQPRQWPTHEGDAPIERSAEDGRFDRNYGDDIASSASADPPADSARGSGGLTSGTLDADLEAGSGQVFGADQASGSPDDPIADPPPF